jgi:hypothetical protein
MTRFTAILILTLCLSFVTSAQITEPVSVSSVAGTAWAGIVNAPDFAGRFQDYAYEFEFLPGNRLSWRWRGTVYVNGSWQQNGRDILMELNDGDSTWRGTMEDNRMSGTSLNKEGYKWKLGFAAPSPATTAIGASDSCSRRLDKILFGHGTFRGFDACRATSHGARACDRLWEGR